MSWRDCIQTAIETGRISSKKGGEAFAAYDEAFERATAEGAPEGEAAMRAADEAVKEITTLKAVKRWQRVNEMQRAHEIFDRIMSAKDPRRALEELINEADLSYDSIRGMTMANLDRLMKKYKPSYGGLHIPTAGLDDIVRASYGDVRSTEAKQFADAVAEAIETLRLWANRYGANIPDNPNRVLFQTHDQAKVSAVTEDMWVNEHLQEGVLDWEIMRFAGKEIPEDQREEILRRTYRGIVNDGMDRENLAQGNAPGLATRLNRDRFLYYADAEAYLTMQEKYGSGNFYEQLIGMIDAMSKDISILRHFGPSADANREFAKRVAGKRASDLNNARPAGKKDVVKKTEAFFEVFDDMYRIHARHVPALDGNWPMQTWSTIRTLAVSAKLGGVFIPSLYGDLANARVARRMFNLPEVSVFRAYFREFTARPEKRMEAIRSGVIFENGISLAFNRQRYFAGLDGPHFARRISDMTYRMGLAAHHTQVARNAAGKQIMGVFADYAGKGFDDLPFAPLLTELGVTPKDWDRFRTIAPYTRDGATFLRPLDLARTGDDADAEIARKFSNVMQLYVRTAVPDTTLRSRRAMGEAVDPNSIVGQGIRTLGSLLSFPVTLWLNQLRRIVEAPGIRNKLTLSARYFMWMTVGGMFITQAKALVNGQQLYNMDPFDEDQPLGFNWDFYMRSLINGGSLGIFGDFIFNNINVSNSSYKPGNPTEEYLRKLHKLTIDNLIDYARGEEIELGKDVLGFVDANVPDLWWMKLAWQRGVSDEIFKETDPAGWARYERYLREHEEGMWWEPGDEPTVPQLETAFGD